ncbi:protein-L-isoaspartate O-methyltransferase [Aureimonas sp. SA4125]|uniref:protein-L-isoaspartate O-methyltransferase family protein n=1 Tax=Aureimonas sp. SA4125 TaxID=2826993 RepID=UPI001CC74AE8|nr:protein-L-isoaspartate O-methyltransferase [Aureimonas sp. SA4125]BDA84334.1 protein-L-isoaspartate O-methyltransferase [Aureimonas sp. SA4125]
MDFAAARIKMVDNQVRTTDVTDARILRALLSVPRETFVPEARRSLAYIDDDLSLGEGRFLMEASPFARLLQLAGIGAGDRVLVIGCGSGYSAAVVAQLAADVVVVESSSSLAQAARDGLAQSAVSNCTVIEGPLTDGHAAGAPYDVVFVEGAVDVVPAGLFKQLAESGRLIVVEGLGNAGFAVAYLNEEGVISRRTAFNCSVKPLPGFAQPRAFSF